LKSESTENEDNYISLFLDFSDKIEIEDTLAYFDWAIKNEI